MWLDASERLSKIKNKNWAMNSVHETIDDIDKRYHSKLVGVEGRWLRCA